MQQVETNFLPWLKQAIPLTEHLGIQSLAWHEGQLKMDLALAPLVNDKGTGFGGGVAGLATLVGWCYVTLVLDQHFERCPVVVKESSNRFTAPITGDFSMLCGSKEQDLERFLSDYEQQGRASLLLSASVTDQQKLAFSYQGTYVALGN